MSTFPRWFTNRFLAVLNTPVTNHPDAIRWYEAVLYICLLLVFVAVMSSKSASAPKPTNADYIRTAANRAAVQNNADVKRWGK